MTPGSAMARGWWAEIARLGRSRVDLILLTLMPALLLALMGAMISGGSLRDEPVVIVDRDGGAIARAIRRTIDGSPMLKVVAVLPDIAPAMSMIRSEHALAVLVIPRGVGEADPPPVEILYQAQFLASGSIAQATMRAAATQAIAQATPRLVGANGVVSLPIPLPGVRVTLLGNQTVSLGWYLGLLLGPAVIHLLFAVSAIGAVAPLMVDRAFASHARATPRARWNLVGRLAPMGWHAGSGASSGSSP